MSSIVVARAHLLPALSIAGKAADRKNTIPILNNVLFESDGERLRIVGTNLDQEISAAVPLVSGEALASTLPAQHLLDAVKTLPESAEVGFAFDSTHVTVSSGKSRFRLPVLPAGDFPSIAGRAWPHSFKLAAAAMQAMIAQTSFAVSIAKDRLYLHGVFLHDHEGRELRAAATDGHRLARHVLPLPEGAAGMAAVIIPTAALGLIRSIAGDKGDLTVSVSDTLLRVETDDMSLTTKLVDGVYPDYQRVIPSGNANRFRVKRAALDLAVARVMAVASIRGSGLRFDFGREGVLALSAASEDREASDEIACTAEEGKAVTIGISGGYLRDTLAATAADEIVIALGDAGDPVLIDPAGSAGQLFVIMPMRI